MTIVVALTGISGVGKSSMLARIARIFPFQHLQASALIKASREEILATKISVDQLRNEDIDENQRILVTSFARALNHSISLAVLDGHTVVERSDGVEVVPASVFQALGVQAMICLVDNPESITARRIADGTRKRPAVSIAEVERLQELACQASRRIAENLRIRFEVLSPSDDSKLLSLFESMTKRM